MRILAPVITCLLVSMSFPCGSPAEDEAKADNTAQNKGALRRDAVTAERQPNDSSDVKTLSAIRRSIERANGLSMDAKNVKVLYSKGTVTLRGPVDSEEEKAKVEDLAKCCRGVSSVENELTVAAKSH